jgi:hypothetical protein
MFTASALQSLELDRFELCEYCIASLLLAKMQQKLKMQVLYNRLHENLGRVMGWIILYLSIPTVLL